MWGSLRLAPIINFFTAMKFCLCSQVKILHGENFEYKTNMVKICMFTDGIDIVLVCRLPEIKQKLILHPLYTQIFTVFLDLAAHCLVFLQTQG